ncbi:hypothetical protein [Caldilinea sp.]|uniref:hypothetical protein n=1 Tax=Caldilinea sp. TaxID=2293560 RepID=UPI002C31EB60|nr:hypothetical protein [Anaerolineales bacterium]HQY92253.1 hypothetical protein [Caldilinea sp.]HRA67462.1 hypothetical protein [Caldilinea sp.]
MSTGVAQSATGRRAGLTGEQVVRWVVPLALLLAFAGYVGAWVDHKVAGLVITGLDLGEYVKFLTPVRSGEVTLWREGFYLPLIAVSLTASLIAFRAELRYGWPVRAGLLTLAIVAALNLLPPAWTPPRMMTDEFRQQIIALVVCLAAMALSPLWALAPRKASAVIVAILSVSAAFIPVRQFLAVLPAIGALYNQPQTPGWGMVLCAASLLAVAGAILWFGWRRHSAV